MESQTSDHNIHNHTHTDTQTAFFFVPYRIRSQFRDALNRTETQVLEEMRKAAFQNLSREDQQRREMH